MYLFCMSRESLHGGKVFALVFVKNKRKKEKRKKDILTDMNHDNVQVWRCQVFCRWEISD